MSILFVCMDDEDDSATADDEGDCDDGVIFDNSSRSSDDGFDGDDAMTFCDDNCGDDFTDGDDVDDDGAATFRGNGGTVT